MRGRVRSVTVCLLPAKRDRPRIHWRRTETERGKPNYFGIGPSKSWLICTTRRLEIPLKICMLLHAIQPHFYQLHLMQFQMLPWYLSTAPYPSLTPKQASSPACFTPKSLGMLGHITYLHGFQSRKIIPLLNLGVVRRLCGDRWEGHEKHGAHDITRRMH